MAVDTHPSRRGRTARRLAVLAGLVAVLVGGVEQAASSSPQQTYVLGVSNTYVGTSGRDDVICAVKARAEASGVISKVIVKSRNTNPAGQIADIRQLIAAGANAIIVFPSSPTALDKVIAEAAAQGVEVVSVGQRVTAPQAHNLTDDQVAYGRISARWLFKKLHGKGDVVEMRGIAGVPADTERHTGFNQALEKYPGIKVVRSTFMGWDFAKAGKQMTDILNSGVKVDGVWNSGADYTVVRAFKTAGNPYVPVVGADNNEFLRQLLTLYPQFQGAAAVANPATVAGAGTAVAIKLLQGQKVKPWIKLTPLVWSMPGSASAIRDRLQTHRCG